MPWLKDLADTTTQNWSAKYPGVPIDPVCVVLHTTETASWPSYSAGGSAPHFTGKPNPATKRIEWRQHYDTARSSRALANPAGGVQTNQRGPIQIELCGTSGWCRRTGATAAQKKITPLWPEAEPWMLAEVGRLLAALHAVHPGLPLTCGVKFVPYTQSARLTGAQWNAYPTTPGQGARLRLRITRRRRERPRSLQP